MLSRKTFRCRFAPPLPRPLPPCRYQLQQVLGERADEPFPRPDMLDRWSGLSNWARGVKREIESLLGELIERRLGEFSYVLSLGSRTTS